MATEPEVEGGFTGKGLQDYGHAELRSGHSQRLCQAVQFDWLATIYETSLWYPLFLNVMGGLGSPSLKIIARRVDQMLRGAQGLLLDVACGPGTYGRRLAASGRMVAGIDLSMGMLRQGRRYVIREGVRDVHFAQAQVERLPFADGVFDAAVCGGALHLFGDTVEALREMARCMKPGAPLAVMTLAAGTGGILRFRQVRDHVTREHGVHVFELDRLEGYLQAAGLEGFQPEMHGSLLLFRATRAQ